MDNYLPIGVYVIGFLILMAIFRPIYACVYELPQRSCTYKLFGYRYTRKKSRSSLQKQRSTSLTNIPPTPPMPENEQEACCTQNQKSCTQKSDPCTTPALTRSGSCSERRQDFGQMVDRFFTRSTSQQFRCPHRYCSAQCQESPLHTSYTTSEEIPRKKSQRNPTVGPIIGNFFADLIHDAFWINVGLFSWDTFKIICSVFPFFISFRMIDEKLQNCFYKRSMHRNVSQLPKWCSEVAKFSIGIPIVLFGLQGFIAPDDNLRETGRMFLIGMPFVLFGKELIKKLQFEANLRPWNQFFSCKERAYGGFPSGHMAEAIYMTALYGMRYGPKFAIPLGIVSAFLGVTFLNCNRHYISQLVGGAALGAIYAVSVNKLIDQRLEDITMSCFVDRSGAPTFSMHYVF